MEDTLRVKTKSVMYLLIMVLILVLMEDTLRAVALYVLITTSGLNPCFNGRYSQRRMYRANLR